MFVGQIKHWMKGVNLGELEELVLLTVGTLYPEAYTVNVMDEIKNKTGRVLNVSAVHSVLTRLESKKLLKSMMSEPVDERGGRRKRLFLLTGAGKEALEESRDIRNSLFNEIPKMAFRFKFS